jgi:2-methylisocitrate lyase-like PEP mutase family enzyme
VLAPGIYDGLSARIAEQAGARALYLSGGAVARSTGIPDAGIVTMSEALARAREVVDATSGPVIVDADTGYGGIHNAMRAVKELQRLGVAAIHLEDQVAPKRCGHEDGKQVVGVDEMLEKLGGALEARGDGDMLIIARTDAIAAAGFDEAIERATTYAAAGADMIFVEAPETLEQIRAIAESVQAPLLINMFAEGKTPLVSARELGELRYALVIVPSDLQRAAVRAMQVAAATLIADGSTATIQDRLADFREREEIVGLPALRAIEARHQTRAEQPEVA